MLLAETFVTSLENRGSDPFHPSEGIYLAITVGVGLSAAV